MPRAADLIFRDGRVWSGVPGGDTVESVAIRDGRIVAVGPQHEVDEWRGPRTETVGIGAGLLLPAFIDSHCHPLWGGLTELACDLTAGRDPATWLEMVGRYATAHPDLEVIDGEGWDPYPFEGGWPHRSLLDAVVPDRPVILVSRDGHSTWANSCALERAGITAATVDPPHGLLVRDPEGVPTGVFHEAAKALVERLVPAPDDARLAEGLRRGQAYLHRLGISAWLDAIVDPDAQSAYLDLLQHGQLTGRVTLALRWDPDRGMDQLEELVQRRRLVETEGQGRIRATAVKLFLDGVIESSTAALLEPYADDSADDPAGTGQLGYEPVELMAIAEALGRSDFDLHLHAIGDGGVRAALDAVAAARSVAPHRDARHTIAHLELVGDADIPRFAELGAIADCQPLWAVHDEADRILSSRLGDERLERRYPFGRLREAGASLAMGSDWNVSTADPLQILHVATERTPPGQTQARPLGHRRERLTLEEGLRAYTRGSARVLRVEATSGQVAVGRAADLVLLDDDPFESRTVADHTVRMTMVEGRVVYAR